MLKTKLNIFCHLVEVTLQEKGEFLWQDREVHRSWNHLCRSHRLNRLGTSMDDGGGDDDADFDDENEFRFDY